MSASRIMSIASTAFRHTVSYGVKSTVIEVRKYLQINGKRLSGLGLRDPLGDFSFVNLRAQTPLEAGTAEPRTMNWYVPPVGKGSGGHGNMFRLMNQLELHGFTIRIVIVGRPQPTDAKRVKSEIAEWFLPLEAEVYLETDEVPQAEFGVATEWRTAYYLRASSLEEKRLYFVQDYEPWFYPAGGHASMAQETYNFGFTAITAGFWLAEKLAEDHGMKTFGIGYSYDRSLYVADRPRVSSEAQRVFFYARPPTARRAFELGLLVLQEVTRRKPNVEVVFAGWDVSEFIIPFKHANFGQLSESQLPEVYAEIDVALVLSFTNMSLLPIDFMASGVPVVSNDGPWNTWAINEDSALICRPTVEDLASGVCKLLDDSTMRQELRQNGLNLVQKTNWTDEGKRVRDFLESV